MRTGDVQNHIVPEFGHKRVKDIRAAAVADWIPAMDVAAATKNDILGTPRHIMSEAKRDGIIQRNPIDDVDPVSRSTYNRSDSLSIKEPKKLFPKNTEKLRVIWRRDDLIVAYF